MTDITIPPEALEAAAKVLHAHAEIFDDVPWDDLSANDQEAYMDEARAACLAMLKAWPHATIGRHTVLSRSPSEGHAVHLPLPLPKETEHD